MMNVDANTHATPASWWALLVAWLGTIASDTITALSLQRLVLAATLVFTILQCILAIRKIMNVSRSRKAWETQTDRGDL